MPRLSEEESEELARQVATAMMRSETNGLHGHDSHRPRFDGTINLGHLLTVATLIAALITIYVSNEVKRADHESRIKALESAQAEFKASVARMAETEAQTARNQDKIALTLEYLSRQYSGSHPPSGN